MILWLIGLSGAGKTTIGRALVQELRKDNPATVLVDGDAVRAMTENDQPQDYSLEGRRRNSDRIRRLCRWLADQDILVVCCILSAFRDVQDQNRREWDDYYEVYLRVPRQILRNRQPVDLYRQAEAGKVSNVVGVDIRFPEPVDSDLVLDNGDPPLPLDQAVQLIRKGAAI